MDEGDRSLLDTDSLELAGKLLHNHVVSDTIRHRRASSSGPSSRKPRAGLEHRGTRRLGYSPPSLPVDSSRSAQMSQQRGARGVDRYVDPVETCSILQRPASSENVRRDDSRRMLRTVLHEISPSSLVARSWYSPAS